MGNRLKSSQTRARRGRTGWAAAVAALLYMLLASRPLVQNQRLELMESIAVSKENEAVLQKAGSPFMALGRSFVLRPDQQGVAEIEGAGRLVWAREFGTLVTTNSITATVSAWGLLDGSIQILDKEGNLLHDLSPAAKGIVSKYPCIYAVAISEDGESVAALYGMNPQFFLVFTKKGKIYDLAYKDELEQQVRSAQAASFSLDGSCVIARTADGLALYDTVRKRGQIIHPRHFAGDLELRIAAVGTDSFAILMAKGTERFAGLVRRGAIEAFFTVEGNSSRLLVDGDIIEIWDMRFIHRYRMAER